MVPSEPLGQLILNRKLIQAEKPWWAHDATCFPGERVEVGDTVKKKPATISSRYISTLVDWCALFVSQGDKSDVRGTTHAPCAEETDATTARSFRSGMTIGPRQRARTIGKPLPVLQRVPQRLCSTLERGCVRGK